MQNKFAVTSSPHLRARATSARIMQEVCLALVPAGVMAVYHFGVTAAILIAVCVVTCVVSEYVWQKLMKQKVTISDWSAVVTGLLLAYNLPSHTPWWMAMIGSVLAIVLVKQLFGGIGSNFMNPALTARAILFISWSGVVGSYMPSLHAPEYLAIPTAMDAVTVATPLATLNGGSTFVSAINPATKVLVEGQITLMDLLLGNHGGVIGETCAIALIIGGLYLMLRRIADWRIPVAFIGTVFVCYIGHSYVSQYQAAEAVIEEALSTMTEAERTAAIAADPALYTVNPAGFLNNALNMALYQLLSGGLLLGAFFMATDYATSPITRTGRVIYAVGCGLILFVIRAFCNYPEGCSFAILFMNVVAPMIDRFTMPRPFGEVKKHG